MLSSLIVVDCGLGERCQQCCRGGGGDEKTGNDEETESNRCGRRKSMGKEKRIQKLEKQKKKSKRKKKIQNEPRLLGAGTRTSRQLVCKNIPKKIEKQKKREKRKYIMNTVCLCTCVHV